ncbi:histidine phosphatase family protein [Saccharothrix syringae]|uniref:histidine phosphatase family protein n=1 Tax=Saccharothrix syringae TaxID=103733 RepID=UPI00068D5A76|nr:histidine phosphatase family protein [Saccharothrix syringae]
MGLREWDSGLEPTPDHARHHRYSWDHPAEARPGGEGLEALTARALAALGEVAAEHPGGVVLVGTHGTFAARVLLAAGRRVDWSVVRDMPMPAVHRVRWDGGPTAVTP